MEWLTVRLADGRELDVLAGAGGSKRGLLFHHGTPGNATRYETWFAAAEERGLRPVAYQPARLRDIDPGSGPDRRFGGRRRLGAARPAGHRRVLDARWLRRRSALDRVRCAVAGSCLASAALVTVAPWQADGLDWMAGMTALNVDEFGAALAGEGTLREWMAGFGEEVRNITAEQMIATLGDALPPVDQAVATGEWADHEAAGLRRALEHGFDGWVDDDLAFAQPWGFDLESIRSRSTSGRASSIGSCPGRTASGWPITSPARSSPCPRPRAFLARRRQQGRDSGRSRHGGRAVALT